VSLVEDGFAMAAAAEMSVKLRFGFYRYFADIAVLIASKFSRETRLVTTARQLLAVDDGRAAVNFEDAAALAAARNRRARTTIMVLAEKAFADSNRAPADFTNRKTRDPVLDWDRGWNRHASDRCGAASAAGTRGAENLASRYTRNAGCSDDSAADFGNR
jgi:hypothetical protein